MAQEYAKAEFKCPDCGTVTTFDSLIIECTAYGMTIMSSRPMACKECGKGAMKITSDVT